MKFRALLELGRVSNLPTVWTNMAAGWLIGGGALHNAAFAWTVLGGSLLYLSGMAMNDATDAAWDRRHKGDRPIIRGLISHRAVWALTALYGVGGLAALILGSRASLPLVAGLAFSITAYNVLHKRWAGSAWIMGACRFFLYAIAASAAVGGGNPSPEALVWGAALGTYIVGLTYVARGESVGAPLIRWPLALLGVPALCGLAFAISRWPSWTPVFVVGFVLWTCRSFAILRGGGDGRIGRAVGWLLAGMVTIDALAVSSGWPYVSLALFGAAPFLILLQKRVAAT